VHEAGERALTFATAARYLESALQPAAGGILVERTLFEEGKSFSKPRIVVEAVRRALAELLKSFARGVPRGPFVHPQSAVDPSARVGANVYIGPFVHVGERVTIGDDCSLQSGAVVAADATLGQGCVLHQHAVVLEGSMLGDRVVIHSGAVIGSEGFGWAFEDGRLQKIPQVGNVVLGDDVEIGANTCVDRAQTGSTRIGCGTKIDNLCQIGHNCVIGEHAAFAAQCGLAGSTVIGDFTQVGGQTGFAGHITVGSRAKIAAGTAVWGNVDDDAFVSGRPARPHKDELRREVMVRKLPKLFSRVEALEGRSPHGGQTGEPEL